VLREEGVDALPPVLSGRDAVGGAVDGEEGVARVVVAVELVVLAVGLQPLLQLVDLVGRGVGVLVAEQAQQRGAQLGGALGERLDLQREPLGRSPDDERSLPPPVILAPCLMIEEPARST
jgi:hypothetical protein